LSAKAQSAIPLKISDLKKRFHLELANFFNENERNGMWQYVMDFVFKTSSSMLLIEPNLAISPNTESDFNTLIERLKNKEPIQYIVGHAFFYDSVFKVNSSVLIPRPETEELVSDILKSIQNNESKILDIGTGSGCIAVSIKKARPDSQLTAVDISQAALDIAAQNAEDICGKQSVNFIMADVLSADFVKLFENKFDIIVSNPPYIPENEKQELAENVLQYEPHLALFCQDDPLLFYRAIALHSLTLLTSGGMLFFEIHENFSHLILNLLKDLNFENVQLIRDFQGKDRMVKANKILL